MPSHRAVHVKSAGAALELAEVETTPPSRGEVRISVGACGICGTDAHFVSGDFPGLSWPLTLGHEIAGKIAEIGPGVEDVDPRGPESGHDQIAPLDMRVRGVRAQTGRAGIPGSS